MMSHREGIEPWRRSVRSLVNGYAVELSAASEQCERRVCVYELMSRSRA